MHSTQDIFRGNFCEGFDTFPRGNIIHLTFNCFCEDRNIIVLGILSGCY